VIDGGSTDGSAEIVRRYEPWLTGWVSEPDRGQSHAINKGLRRVDGEVFNWLNSDDVMCPGTLGAVAAAWTERPGTIVAGPVMNFREDGTEYLYVPRGLELKNFLSYRAGRDAGWRWHQPGTFFPLAAVKEVGGVDERMHLSMDHLLMVDLLARGVPVAYLDRTLARFRIHGSSKTAVNGRGRFTQEWLKALHSLPRYRRIADPDRIRAERVEVAVHLAAVVRGLGEYRNAARFLLTAAHIDPVLAAREAWRRLLRRSADR
jgi:hypothetical protein